MSSDFPKAAASVPPLPGSEPGSGDRPETPRLGDVLDSRYVLQKAIGEGGMGLIFRAIQLKVQRPVAVKFLQHEMIGEHSLKPRFEREAMVLAALAHPNIVRLQDYGIERGNPYLVMEFVEGRTLRGVLTQAGGPLGVLRALALTRQILCALAYAHDRGIVHRDLKPPNLIVQEFPNQPEHLKVLDFGFVKFLPGSELDLGAKLTRAGYTFGSPPYMSPEHATGGPVDGRSDIYSVGILLFEMLTGQRPFEGESYELLRHHLATPVPRLAERRAGLALYPRLQEMVDRALAKRPEDRFADAGEFFRELARVQTSIETSDALATRPSVSGGPTLAELRRVTSGYALARLTRLRRHTFPKLLSWSRALLRRVGEPLRRLRPPRD